MAQGNGQLVMKTHRESRFKGFWSGVLHWVYFVPLRKHTYAWNQFIIWGSFAGGLMCLLGLAIGVWRFSPRARFRQKRQPSHSAYSGMMRWHHYAGLLFGLVSFTWVISGAFSVNPFGMFSSGRGGLTREQREILTGGRLKLESVSVDALRAGKVLAFEPPWRLGIEQHDRAVGEELAHVADQPLLHDRIDARERLVEQHKARSAD